jgi:protein-S-isoprenylcysteine O-methyltransferase Ste14
VVKLPPPVWAFLYLIAAGALSWMYPWRRLIDLRIVWLGVALIAVGFAIAFRAISLFRIEGTELNPTSETNKSLIIRGPYRFTRNPIYLGLIVLTLGLRDFGPRVLALHDPTVSAADHPINWLSCLQPPPGDAPLNLEAGFATAKRSFAVLELVTTPLEPGETVANRVSF